MKETAPIRESTISRLPEHRKEKVPFAEQRKEKFQLPPKELAPILVPPPDSFAAEQFRKLRTELSLKSADSHRIIQVTSAVPQEGKSLVAFNLATTISQDVQKRSSLSTETSGDPAYAFRTYKTQRVFQPTCQMRLLYPKS